jgi:hypothetical protein
MSADTSKPTVIGTDGHFDGGVIALVGGEGWVEVCRIIARGRPINLRGLVGGNALTHLKVMDAVHTEGTHDSLAVDSDFNTATDDIPDIRPGSPQTTAANSFFRLSLRTGAAEYSIWAQSAAATTVQIKGSGYRVGD